MRGWFAISMMLVAAGCGGKSTCVPGMSAACVCSDGTGGAQVCRGDGTYEACACGVVGTGGNGGSGGAGGGGGTGGTGGAGGGGGSTGTKRVFVTSTAYSAPVAAGICNTVAQAASLSGTWVPWLSTSAPSATDAINAIKGTGPWVMLDGTEVFANHAQLATMPTAAMAVTEKMTKLSINDDHVFTGTMNGGVHGGGDCNNWASATSNYGAMVGHATVIAQWTEGTSVDCSANAHVYCFEQ